MGPGRTDRGDNFGRDFLFHFFTFYDFFMSATKSVGVTVVIKAGPNYRA